VLMKTYTPNLTTKVQGCLYQPSGPDGEGQARGQARKRASRPRMRPAMSADLSWAKLSPEWQEVALVNICRIDTGSSRG
jgi:hypothetical protein